MSSEENKKIYLQLIERQNLLDQNDIDQFVDQFYNEFYTLDYFMHFPGSEWGELDLAGVKKVSIQWFQEHTNCQNTVDDIFAEGDRVATRGTGTATKAATGDLEKWFFLAIARFSGGKVAEEWQVVAQIPIAEKTAQ
jgi:predicted SnoaL-like aldol condensation-catalyzing enzyme